jgi:tetratricopeptide (TPR) repeat protein/predicted Ser/Thr protein kinase
LAFAEGYLEPEAIRRVEAHALSCSLCQDRLQSALGTGTHERSATVGGRTRGATSAADAELDRGAVVGRYTVLAAVGRGGMGQVYAAYDPDLDRKVALKLMHAAGGRDSERAQGRFLREAQAMAKLSHQNVVAVHDAGTFEGHDFLAMEFVDGETLTDWLAERPRSRHEILGVFASAARGLAAAHAVGLVHRDFKPSNVMIGKDGSVRVTDFGLARAFGDGSDPAVGDAPAEPRPRDLDLTRTGELLGTPLYMAPEQFKGGATDARTDQFSFCVALYHALYGTPPFGRDRFGALMARVLDGRVEPAPPNTAVPAWLRRVLLRGLSVDPGARWPSMTELVTTLDRDPARRRRRWALSVGALSLIALSVLALARDARRTAPLCVGGPARLAGVWEPSGPTEPHPRRDAIAAAFLASGVPGAHEVWDRVATLLDRYRASWLEMYRDSCEATQLRHQQSAALLDLRMTCLDGRRLALSALTNVLVTADRGVVERAVDAARALPTLDRCADREQLEAVVEPPRDEATRERVEDLRARAATAKALNDTGKREEAIALERTQLAEARDIGYRPLIAEELVSLGRSFVGPSYHIEVLAIQREAFLTALAVGRDDLAAEVATELVGAVGCYLARSDEARDWARLANAIIDRAGAGATFEILRSWLLTNEGVSDLHHDAGAALPLFERALAIKERVLPPDHPDIGIGLANKAEALSELGRNEEALPLIKRAHDIYVRAYGPASSEASYALGNYGEYLVGLGRPAEALEPLRQGLAGWEAHLGPDHQFLGYPLTALGRALLALERPHDALPPLERALRLREAAEPDLLLVAETRFALARALWDADTDRARARALAKKARNAYAQAADVKHTADLDAWLVAHTARSRAAP